MIRQRAPIKRSTTRIRQVSIKRAAVLRERREFLQEHVKNVGRICVAGPVIGSAKLDGTLNARLGFGVRPSHREDVHGMHPEWRPDFCRIGATDFHEKLTRARAPGRAALLDPANVIPVCRPCHEWIGAHPLLAEHIGLLQSSRGL